MCFEDAHDGNNRHNITVRVTAIRYAKNCVLQPLLTWYISIASIRFIIPGIGTATILCLLTTAAWAWVIGANLTSLQWGTASTINSYFVMS